MNRGEHPGEHTGAPPAGTRAAAAVRWVLIAVVGAAAIASVTAYLVRRDVSSSFAPGSRAKQILYRCPMHPQIVQDHPGECPICGMTLVPFDPAAPAGGGGASGPAATDVAGLVPVTLSPERIQLIGIKTAPVIREDAAGSLRANGVVAASERGLAQITARFSGYTEKLLVAETGQRVARGQVLALVFSPEIVRAEEELLAARRWGQPSGQDATNPAGGNATMETDARRRLEYLGVAAEDVETVVRAGKPAPATPVRALASGHVVQKNVVQGGAVQAGAVLFEIADLSSVWVLAEIYETDVVRVRIGQPARLSLAAYPDEIFAGKVQFIYPTLDETARTLKVRLEFRNRTLRGAPQLRPGMYGDVQLELPHATRLIVPSAAVVDTGDAQYVFVAKAGGRFEPRPVKLGAADGARTEILSGLVEGDTVVTTAGFFVDSESRLRAAIESRP